MEKTIDMSPEAVTNRMLALDSLWELSVALKSSRIIDEDIEYSEAQEPTEESVSDEDQ